MSSVVALLLRIKYKCGSHNLQAILSALKLDIHKIMLVTDSLIPALVAIVHTVFIKKIIVNEYAL